MDKRRVRREIKKALSDLEKQEGKFPYRETVVLCLNEMLTHVDDDSGARLKRASGLFRIISDNDPRYYSESAQELIQRIMMLTDDYSR